ncbi:MAG: formate/nitrite transporter family protein [Synergistaceae bacterium]|nr:formate/nitrite transporter family protein [Synergistaceae bacterium]
MFQDEFQAVASAAKAKSRFLEGNPSGFFVSSMLAGAYIGFGILLIFTVGGLLAGASCTKIVMGLSFGVALSLVIIAGAELFTGNVFVMTSGYLVKKVGMGETVKLWLVCWFGNLAGSALLALLFWGSGLASGGVGAFIANGAAGKVSLAPLPLFLRGVLCNILVCLAVWCGFRCKSESAKLIMIFWNLFAFITCGFEHSIANMTLLTIALLQPEGIAVSGWLYNLLTVTAGNMAGAILCLAVPYFIISGKKEA